MTVSTLLQPPLPYQISKHYRKKYERKKFQIEFLNQEVRPQLGSKATKNSLKAESRWDWCERETITQKAPKKFYGKSLLAQKGQIQRRGGDPEEVTELMQWGCTILTPFLPLGQQATTGVLVSRHSDFAGIWIREIRQDHRWLAKPRRKESIHSGHTSHHTKLFKCRSRHFPDLSEKGEYNLGSVLTPPSNRLQEQRLQSQTEKLSCKGTYTTHPHQIIWRKPTLWKRNSRLKFTTSTCWIRGVQGSRTCL